MLLKKGSKGEEVKKLQIKLGLNPDGDFGNGTESKVIQWQSSNGLKADGIVGDTTWNKMFERHCPIGEKGATGQPGLNFNHNLLKGHIPDSVLNQIPETAIKFNITTKLRLAHFLAQCAHESGNFKAVSENLNYGESGLLNTFKSDFDVNKDRVLSESEKIKAKELARKSEPIANFVYANQNGNGNEASGDGWKYRGRGYIQLTSRNNYIKFDNFVNDDIINNPDLVSSKYPLASAAFFFDNNNLWKICDKGSSDDIVTLVSKKVNGGTIGLEDRLEKFKLFFSILS